MSCCSQAVCPGRNCNICQLMDSWVIALEVCKRDQSRNTPVSAITPFVGEFEARTCKNLLLLSPYLSVRVSAWESPRIAESSLIKCNIFGFNKLLSTFWYWLILDIKCGHFTRIPTCISATIVDVTCEVLSREMWFEHKL